MKAILLLISSCLFVVAGAQTLVASKDSISVDSTQRLNDDYYKTHFLWFTGHWNDKKNVFTTTPNTQSIFDTTSTIGGGGTTISVSPQGTVNIQSASVDEWNQKVENGLKQLQKFEDELREPSSDAKEWGHHFEEVTLPVLNDLQIQWNGYKVEDKQKELTNLKPDNSLQKSRSWSDILQMQCSSMKADYEKIISFYRAHKNDKSSDLSYDPPPAHTFQCYACDTSLEQSYKKQDDEYVKIFFQPESDLIGSALAILREMYILGVGPDFHSNNYAQVDQSQAEAIYQALKTDKKNPQNSGACAFYSSTELANAIDFLGLRRYYKAEKLFNDYKTNVETARPVIKILLTATREAKLMDIIADENGNLAECAGLISRVLEYYFDKKLLQEHDWSQLANVPFIYGLERQREMMGAHESDIFERMGKLLNSFHLSIDMDIKIGKENKAYQITHLTGKTKIAPEFDFANDTCYRWVAVEDQPDMSLGAGFPQPKKKASQKIECQIVTNEFVAPGPRPVYAGTKNYYVLLYGLKMDYCHPGKDTILLSSFIAEPDPSAGIWQIPMSPPQAMGTWQIEHMFQDVSTMKELAQSGKAKQQAEMMKQQGQQIAAQMKSIQAQMSNKKGIPNMDQLHKIQDLAAKAINLSNNENVAPILSIDFPLEIKNNTTTLQDKRYDAKEINPEEATAIIYGYYTVRVVYQK
jgi:hypothetical protein